MKTKWIALTVVLVAIVAVAAFGSYYYLLLTPTTSEVKEIKIGSIHPMSGATALEGQRTVSALEVAVEEINAAGGIKSLGGAKLVLVYGDSEGKPEKGTSEAERLIREGCVALTGTTQSAVALAATQVCEQYKVPFVITIAAAPQITQRGFNYTFRLQPTCDTYVRDMLDYIQFIEKKGGISLKTVALLHDDSVFGVTQNDLYVAAFAKVNITVVTRIPFSLSTTDLTTELLRIKDANPDFVIQVGYLNDALIFTRDAAKVGITPKVIFGGPAAFVYPDFVNQMGAKAAGFLTMNMRMDPKNANVDAFEAAYARKTGVRDKQNAPYAYTVIKVIADAVERAASNDRMKIRDAIATSKITDHLLPQGPIQFDATGENTGARSLLMQLQKVGSAWDNMVVYPDAYAEATIVFPVTWSWVT